MYAEVKEWVRESARFFDRFFASAKLLEVDAVFALPERVGDVAAEGDKIGGAASCKRFIGKRLQHFGVGVNVG